MDIIDLVIIGAGWSGLTAAQTFLEVNPLCQLVILEQASSVGGVWAKNRLHPGLQTDSPAGTYEFGGFPLDTQAYGLSSNQRVPGDVVHSYFDRAIDRFRLRERLWLESHVTAAEYQRGGTWDLTITQPSGTFNLQVRKLIVATGVKASVGSLAYPGQDMFGGLMLHAQELAMYSQTVLQKQDRRVIVYGGDWMARNAVHACALWGRRVYWVVPERECAYVGMALSRSTGLTRPLEHVATTRFFSHLHPCVLEDREQPRRTHRFLHRTWLGRKVVGASWGLVKRGVQMGLPTTHTPSMQQIRDCVDPIHTGISFSHPDLARYLQDGTIRLEVAEISHLSPHTVHLSTGKNLLSSTLILTGWDPSPSVDFFPSGITKDLSVVRGTESGRSSLTGHRNQDILRQFPGVPGGKTTAECSKPTTTTTTTASTETRPRNAYPHRLIRLMVPPALMQTQSLVFLGTGTTPLAVPIQALWATAYLTGKMECPGIARPPSWLRSSAKSSLRYPLKDAPSRQELWGSSKTGRERYPEMLGVWEAHRGPQSDIPLYLDLLLGDIGLSGRRKSGALAEAWSPYSLRDYRGLVGEWKKLTRGTDRLEAMIA